MRQVLFLTSIALLAGACAATSRGTALARYLVLRDSVYLANMVVAQTSDGAVVIDNTMFRDVTTAFLDSATRTLSDSRLALLINTHGHDDHTWGNQVFAARGVSIAAHPATIAYMTRRIDEMRVFRERGPAVVAASRDSLATADSTTAARLRARIDRVTMNLERHGDLRVTVPTIAIERDSSWRIGGARIHVLALGVAHSTGDLAVLLPDHGVAVVGDLIGSDELPGLNPDGDLALWASALDRINAVARDLGITRVIPGRGPETTVAALACNRAYLEALRTWAQSAEPVTMVPAREAAQCGLRLDSTRHGNNSTTARAMRTQRVSELSGRARTLLTAGQFAAAQSIFDSATALDPANAALWAGKANALHRLEHYPEAMIAIGQAITLSPEHAGYRFNRALTRSEIGDFAGALADLDRSIQLRPTFAPAWTERGAVKALMGMADAKDDWVRSLQLDSTYIWARFYNGLHAVAHGNFAEAITELDAVVQREQLPAAHLWRWVAHASAGRQPPQLPTAGIEWPGPIVAYLRGELDANALVRRASEMRLPLDDRRLASAHFFIAQKLNATGDVRGAARELARVLEVRAPRHAEGVAADLLLRRLRARDH